VSNSATSNVGIDTTAGNFTYASNVPSTTRGLTKLGANTLTLTGSDSYTGATSVNAGTLIVSGSISGSTTTVANTAILTGSGTTGPVIVDSSGTLEPENAAGTAVGTLDTGALTLNGAATFALKLDTAAGTASKDIDSGGLSLASGDTAVLSLTDFGTSTALANGKVFAFIDYSGTWNGNTFSGYANLSTFTYGANTYEINYAGVDPSNSSTAVTLMVMVPEPGCGALLGLGAAVGLLALRRRRGGAGSPRR
jgi:autotransporter-associated beta strand protein